MPRPQREPSVSFNLKIPKRLVPGLHAVAKRRHRSVTQQILNTLEDMLRQEGEPVNEPVEPHS